MKTAIVTDSGSGLNKQQADALGIYYLPLQIIVNDNMYLDGVDIQVEQIYEMLKQGEMPTTSMPPMGIIEELFHKLKRLTAFKTWRKINTVSSCFRWFVKN